MIMITIKSKSKSKSKIKLAYCQLHIAYYSRILLTAFCLLAFTTEINPTIRYVSKTGSSTPPYTSWETASDSIQKCIDISVFGDTIYVANGVYKEQVIMIPGLSLIGAGSDSCIVDTRSLNHTDFNAVILKDSCTFRDFQILVSEPHIYIGRGIHCIGQGGLVYGNKILNGGDGIWIFESDIHIKENFIHNQMYGLWLSYSSSIIKGNTITSNYQASGGNKGIRIADFFHTATPQILNNYVEASSIGIHIAVGTYITTISNNVIVLTDRFSRGTLVGSADTTKIFNNLILTGGFNNTTGIANTGFPRYIFNNLIYGHGVNSVGINANSVLPIIKNNSIINTQHGIERLGTGSVSAYYNNAWNNTVSYKNFIPDTTNISVDPMLMNEDSLDFRLQMYSPLIDAGDPDILDVDGSRSDIGLYGGPYGWTYTYMDLAPRPPHNLTAVIEAGLVKLTWNKNTEADFSHYRIYRDTVSNFIYDTTKIVGTTIDTVFYDNLPITNSSKTYFYKLTAMDNQNNQSAPSEEIPVSVTGMTEHPPIGYDDYKLLSNYPNPFNPSTIIPYRLKEAGYVKLYIYDMKGELVKILVNQWQEKGYYEVVFHPTMSERKKASSLEVMMGPTYSDKSSGVYLYQIMVRGEGDMILPPFSS